MSAIVNAYVDGGEEHVVLCQRREDGSLATHRVLADYCVYFRQDEVPGELRRKWRRDPLCRGYKPEGEWLRTRWRGYNARRAVLHEMHEQGVPTYEGDCSPVKRWMADHPEVQIQKPHRVYLDLETDSRVHIGKVREEGARILVAGLVAEDGSKQAVVLEDDTDAAERVLLKRLFELLDPYDQVCAWNGDEFDFEVVKKRLRDRRLSWVFPKRFLRMDHMVLYKRLNLQVAESGEEKQSFALNAVAKAQLGDGHGKTFDASRSYEEWAAGGATRARLVEGCLWDAERMRLIEQKTSYLKLHQTVAEICAVFPDTWALRPTAQMDGFLLRLGHQRSVHFPSVMRSEEKEEIAQYKGSYNKDPPERAGILKDVHVVDFSSMYPSIMISWNMSYETKVMGPVNGPIPEGMCRAPKTRVCFGTKTKGIIPEALEHFLAERKKWSALRASLPPGTPEAHDAERWTNGFKVVPNAFYGGQGNAGCRFHDRAVAESITQTGAWLAERTEVALNERAGRKVVFYIDTDGLWMEGVERVWVEESVRWLNDVLYPRLLAECGCGKNIVKIAYEKEFARLVMVKAKNYVGVYNHFKGTAAVAGSKPEIKGLAYKRGDQTRFTRTLQAEAIDLLMGGMKTRWSNDYQVPTEELATYEQVVGQWRTLILEGELAVEDVQTVKGLSQELKDYAQKKSTKGNVIASPPHVRVARVLKERGEDVGPGTKIAYVVTDSRAKPQAVIPACDYRGECDRTYLWDDVVWPPTQRLLESAFPNHDWGKFDAPKKPKAVAASSGRPEDAKGTGDLFAASSNA